MKKLATLLLTITVISMSSNVFACATRPSTVNDTGLTANVFMVSNENGEYLFESGTITSDDKEYEVIINKASYDQLSVNTVVIYQLSSSQKIVINKVTDSRLPQPRGSVSSAGMSRDLKPNSGLEFGKNYQQGACGIAIE